METHRTPDSVLDFERKEVNDMAKIPKLIKALLNFSNALPEQLLNQGYAVQGGFALLGNSCEMNSFVQDCGHGQDFPV